MPKEYAHALHASLLHAPRANHERILDAFFAHIARAGKKKALVQILRELERLVQKDMARADTCKVAREKDKVLAQKVAIQHNRKPPVVITDETLIGGYVYTAGSTRIDASYKRVLLTLYQSIIHH